MNEHLCIFNIFLHFKYYRFYFIFRSTEHSLNCHLQILSTSSFISLPNYAKLKQSHVCSKWHQNYSSVTVSKLAVQVGVPVLLARPSLEMVLLPAGILAAAKQYLAEG